MCDQYTLRKEEKYAEQPSGKSLTFAMTASGKMLLGAPGQIT
jgi:hypothetical protein